MFCDQIVAEGLVGHFDKKLERAFRDKVVDAHKFVLAPDFAQAADELSGNMKEIVKALPFVRLPYPLVWLEVAQRDRPSFVAGRPPTAWEGFPTRVGYLLESTAADLSAWDMHLLWRHDPGKGALDPGNHISLMAANLDLNRPLDPRLAARTDEQIVEHLKAKGLINEADPRWNKDRAAGDLLASLYVPRVPDVGVPHDLELVSGLVEPKKIAEFLFQIAVRDWSCEMQYVYSVLGLLNARNASETREVDNSEFNRKRRKRGQRELFSHKLLTIHPRQKEYARAAEAHYGRDPTAAIRRHFVRGHFKTRKTGIYFWRPFVRGRLSSGAVSKVYEVE